MRERLLDAAIQLAGQRGFDAVGIRRIARAAGVTPGMISYYFGGKNGLFEAMLDRFYLRLVDQIRAFRDDRDAAAGDPIARLVNLQTATLASAPWIPQLIVREVLGGGAPMRAFFAERIASGPATLIPALIRREMEAGRLRGDLDPLLTMLSMIGMTMFPYLVHPVLGEVLGFELDDDFRRRLAEHTQRLLAQGLSASGGAP